MDRALAERFHRASLGPRTLTAVAGIPLLFVALWLGGVWWTGITAIVAVLGWIELNRLTRSVVPRPGDAVARLLSAWAGVVVFAIAAWAGSAVAGILLAGWFLIVAAGGPVQYFTGRPAAADAGLILAPLYLGMPMGLLARWRVEFTAWSILAFLLVIWANDIAAYFVGLAWGRHKLAPRISPGKSWEGAVAGIVAGGAVGALAASLLGMRPVLGLVFGVLTTAASQVGDLLESAMKRRAGVKDSGAILPGHGGILDRFDGILVAAPIAYVLIRLWAASPR